MDPSWCPGCDRLIPPKRFLVPINTAPTDNQPSQQQSPPLPPPPPASTPVPSSPQVRKKQTQPPKRLGGGLLHGTGRVRPGAPLKPSANGSDNSKNSNPAPSKKDGQPRLQTQSQQRKSRVVISQDPTPLYCSEECRVRDLKNSFIESDSAGFAGAPAALKYIARLEHIQQLEKRIQNQRNLTRRHSSNRSPTLSQSSTDSSDPSTSALSPPLFASQSTLSTSDPKSRPKPIFRTTSYSSTSTTASSSADNNKDRTARPTPRRNSSTSVLMSRVPSWGSPTKAALAPPTMNLFNASSASCSLDSATNTSISLSMSMSSIFDGSYTHAPRGESVDTEGTTPSGSGGSGPDEKRKSVKAKRVSFASDSKPLVESPEEKVTSTSTSATQIASRGRSTANIHTNNNNSSTDTRATIHNEDWRSLSRTRRRNPLQDAHPLLEALSLSPKDRRARPSSLPTNAAPAATTSTNGNPTQLPSPLALAASHSTPAIAQSTSNLRRSATAASTIYKVAMWPEDEKRTTESAQVHGELLRTYAKRFGPREGRSLVWSPLWVSADRASSSSTSPLARDRQPTSPTSPTGSALTTPDHEAHSDSDSSYWRQWESEQAARRARRKAESEVARLEEERVIGELLGGAGMKEEDQPQARRMRRMAYDGMPGPAELRGLTYRFEKFLYDLGDFTQGYQNGTQSLGQDGLPVPVQEKKRLFNFEED